MCVLMGLPGRGGGFLFFLLCGRSSARLRLLSLPLALGCLVLALLVVDGSRRGGLCRCDAWAWLGVRGVGGVLVRLGCVRASVRLF